MKKKTLICAIFLSILTLFTVAVYASPTLIISGPRYVAKGKAVYLKSNKKVSWKSSNRSIARVTSKGKIKGLRKGTVRITAKAKDGSEKKTWKITVKKKAVKKVKVTVHAGSVQVGSSVVFKTRSYPTAASQEVTWKSSNDKIARVNSAGKVTGVRPGTVKITATASDGSRVKKSVRISIKNPPERPGDYGVWNKRITAPSGNEINNYNASAKERAPYVAGWLRTDSLGRFTQYAIDFKADYAPPYTYCSLANFYLDYASLKTKYSKVYCEGICGYAGFQQRSPNQAPASILSLWDVYCEDTSGQIAETIRASLIYPESNGNDDFDNEGSGVHHISDYEWKPGNWYRMMLQIGKSESTGNSTLEQWACNLSTGVWTKLCVYDLGVPDVAFVGNTAVFLENYWPSTAGNIRTLEVKNVRAKKENGDTWTSIFQGDFAQNFDWPGSYNFGTDGDIFWIVTTGVPGKADNKPNSTLITISESST